jgi:hypothetical protein
MRKLPLSTLVILGILIGLYSCKDMGSEIAKLALSVSSLSVTLNPGGQASLVVRGGNPPYTISVQPNAALASATLTNHADGTATLLIQAVAGSVSGTTSVKIKDTDTHGSASDNPLHEENEIEISIRVTPALVSFSTEVQPIFTASCVNAGCHPGGGAPFSLQASVSRDNLVGVDMQNSNCGGKRVVAGDASASGLVKKLVGNCGQRMPLGGSPLSQAQLDLVSTWINQGAQNN